MYVHRSNRMEALVEELAAVVRRAKLAVLSPETILIQSQGMERWLRRELASRLGAFANARFPFPRVFLREAMDAVLGPAPQGAFYEREVMTWAIADLFREHAGDRPFAAVSRYLGSDPGGLRTLQLAERVAHLFDQYLIYRPKLILDWQAGRGQDWQAVLWRSLVARYDRDGAEDDSSGRPESPASRAHFAARAAEFERSFSPLFVERGALPPRVCIVGGVSLPPLFLRLLGKLAESVEVHLFCLVPTREYLGHAASAEDGLAWTEGGADVHPLLASLGGVGAAFQQILEEQVTYVDGPAEFVDPSRDTLLHALQSDLLNNRWQAATAVPTDDSIRLVSCHSPMREVEVLKDRLFELFDADPSLRPDDVVVMAPRIDRYVPLIEAVFSRDPRDAQYIPYRIADLSERNLNPAAEVLLQLLEVMRGRLKSSEVLDLLQSEPLRRRFGIEATDLQHIHRWVHDAGIRWGEDAAHRAEHGLPAELTYSWRFGLRRLLLGYALSDDERTRFFDTVPYDRVAGDQVELLGKFARFCETLLAARALVKDGAEAGPGRMRTVGEWCELLGQVADAFVADVEGAAWQLRPVHRALYDLAESARLAGFEAVVSLEVIATALARHFEEEKHGADFLAGGVTFCALLPLRSIPFRVVYLLGMSDGEFPRIEQRASFDKLAESPRLGDRSLRAEDRYLFLETLLSARERLIVSYVGRGIQDNEDRPPAVVVSELQAVVAGEAQSAEPALTPVQYPLQPFSPRSFDGSDPRLASYAEMYAAGARALVARRRDPVTPLFPSALASPLRTDGGRAAPVELTELARFFENPARGLLRRLGIQLDEDVKLVEDREPVESDALVRYQIGSRLINAEVEALSEHELTELARGVLPPGAPGRETLKRVGVVAGAIRAIAAELRRYGRHVALPVEVTLGQPEVHRGHAQASARELVGVLEQLFYRGESAAAGRPPLRLVTCTYGRVLAKHELGAWIRHLTARGAGVPLEETLLLGRGPGDELVLKRFGPVAEERARALLWELTSLYQLGQRLPLPLFPTLSRAFAVRVGKAPDDPELERRALVQAEREFESDRVGSEGADVYVQWAFRGRSPLSDVLDDPDWNRFQVRAGAPGFVEVSRRVFEPLLDCIEDLVPEDLLERAS